MPSPRLAEEDRLIPEDLLSGEYEGEWVRVSAYSKGHKVSRVGDTAVCGVPLVYDERWWDELQVILRKYSGYDIKGKGNAKWSPTPYFLALDRRDAKNRCSDCKTMKDWNEAPAQPAAEPRVITGDTSPFGEVTVSDKLQQQRWLTKVRWVASQFGAEVLGE